MNPEDISALKQTVARFVEREVTPSMGAMEAAWEFPQPLIEAMGSAGLFGGPSRKPSAAAPWGFMPSP